MRSVRAGLGSAVVLALVACSSSKLKTVAGCQMASDCGNAADWTCDTANGECHCVSDAACPSGQFCNPAGFCQAKVTCYTNADCPSTEVCDFTSNVCIAQGRCTTDAECALGQICPLGSGTCQSGCHDYSDCALPDQCLCTDASGSPAPCVCATTDAGARAGCPVGQCSAMYCPVTSECPYGDKCLPLDGGALSTCGSDYDSTLRPYCDDCQVMPGDTSYCGSGANFCLTSTANGMFGSTYCGVDCSLGQTCPSGYHCAEVVTVRSIGCSQSSDCPTGPVPCQVDSDCGDTNGLCRIPPGQVSGFCAGQCYKHEGAVQGFCSCTADSECNQDTCDSATRQCSISRRDCSLEGMGCAAITCVPFHSVGGCLIGENCVPDDGLSCQQVHP